MKRFFWIRIAALFCLPFASQAQQGGNSMLELPVGSGPGQLGLTADPNAKCVGPSSITAADFGRVAVLDQVNRKILIVAKEKREEVRLPENFVDPVDLVATTNGFVVAGRTGDVVFIDKFHKEVSRTHVDLSADTGTIRLLPGKQPQLQIEDVRNKRFPVNLGLPVTETFVSRGAVLASSYTQAAIDEGSAILSSDEVVGPLKTITVIARKRMANARVLWVSQGEGALLAVDEYQKVPTELAYVRLVRLDMQGAPEREAMVPANAFSCDSQQPYALLTNGQIFTLGFAGPEKVTLREIVLSVAPSFVSGSARNSEVSLISSSDSVFAELERKNGTASISAISLAEMRRPEVIQRARDALSHSWTLGAANFSHSNVPNRCNPPAFIWRRPARLDNFSGKLVNAVPYRWGGYVRSLADFDTNLGRGRLAGDDCTCRNADCVHPEATGLDCSGFVSFAWSLGFYKTTLSLPSSDISQPVPWDQLAQGDILNKTRSHVRLVESVSGGATGTVTVIESAANLSCGGVCRMTYRTSDMRNQGYQPLRRLQIRD
jgi:hypothetical protein